jgi:hypothetical protein|tara:strand:+ start:258 stop:491 length:234 start_codon:yes stop_codon:yes gene_type:complete
MDESQIVDIWTVFKDTIDKKSVEIVAERYVECCADYGATDEAFTAAIGSDNVLDDAISYYLDIDDEDVLDEEIDWDE